MIVAQLLGRLLVLGVSKELGWWQVTNALNEADSARHEVPYAFIQHLLHAPAALEALHSGLKPGSGMFVFHSGETLL